MRDKRNIILAMGTGFLTLIAGCGSYGPGGMHGPGGGPGAGPGAMPGLMGGWGVMGFFFWIFVILALFFVVRAMTGRRADRNLDDSPMRILKERYARGEIDQTEFEARKRDLTE